jgi:ribulose-bisphosphate carboxylase large chain
MNIDRFIFTQDFDPEDYIVASYFLESATDFNLYDISKKLALGQSIGNPVIRSVHEIEDLFRDVSVKIMAESGELKRANKGQVKFAFPSANLNLKEDGINQLLCHLMGGHLDINAISKCWLLDIKFPKKFLTEFKGPRFGVAGIREFMNVCDKPILGSIIKPKVGLNKFKLLDIVKELIDGGVNFIKEDEIMSDPSICPLEERVPYIMKHINNSSRNIVYACCINSDYPYFIERAKRVCQMGGNCVHLNIWSGLSAYKSLRDLDLPIMLFLQKSGNMIFTNPKHDFHISWNVICYLARLMGADFVHAGMWGGYSHDEEFRLLEAIKILTSFNDNFRETLPSLSCGMHPGLVKAILTRFGNNVMLNVGGAIHGHPSGSKAGAVAMRQAIELSVQNKFTEENIGQAKELEEAIRKWGYRE